MEENVISEQYILCMFFLRFCMVCNMFLNVCFCVEMYNKYHINTISKYKWYFNICYAEHTISICKHKKMYVLHTTEAV